MSLWWYAVAGVAIKSDRSCHAGDIWLRQKLTDSDAAKLDQLRQQPTAITSQ